jgi:agmatinase
LIPAEPRFIACRAALPQARIVVFGIPFEGRVNLRRGADHGPRELRLASDSIETYSPFLGRDLEDLAIADLGDCELGDGSPREQLARAREEIRRFWRPGLLPVMLGGDHTATLPVIEVLAPAIPELRVLQLDAHPDLREEFLGERYNYASAMARVMDVVAPERVFQVGMRTGAREEYQRKAPHLYPAHRIHPVEAVKSLLPELREPCGITASELVEIVRLLEPCRIVGTDMMEVAPAWDPSGRTGITASWILREAILSWWGK